MFMLSWIGRVRGISGRKLKRITRTGSTSLYVPYFLPSGYADCGVDRSNRFREDSQRVYQLCP